jgi:hypothetical protein
VFQARNNGRIGDEENGNVTLVDCSKKRDHSAVTSRNPAVRFSTWRKERIQPWAF